MPITIPFHFVDVFADGPLRGNPVSLVDDADNLDDATMRAIAREFNQSETTFILTPTESAATVRLRSFTPNGAEVFGAGHNALGTWLWLIETKLGHEAPAGGFAQQIGDEILPVEVTREPGGQTAVSMSQSAPTFGKKFTDRSRLAGSLGLGRSAISAGFDAQVVSTGAGHLLVPLIDKTAVDGAVPDARKLTAILEEVGGEGCLLYSLDPNSADALAYARFFNPIMGISEDPATGTAAGPLVALLISRGQALGGITAIIEQGYLLGRPSRIRVTVNGTDVRVSGSGVVVADGVLHL
ncbi:PhzF family phenazine biosynthesis protein [Rathayibacter soli]|uniref:PhzF family phenazine biosynthesis protein n=1 Tax=Rathayibacter soli TaxID=3144168 RepID=UPI0027E3E755|nr:PhzF family phenazine biosynthesis protein [Glaciibacter superstes]